MYNLCKHFLFLVLPKKFLFRFEYGLRYIYSLLYAGDNVVCNLCGGHFSRFVRLYSGDQLCPRCGSLSRHRRLWQILQDMHLVCSGMEILHFSASRIVSAKMRLLAGSNYHTSEYQKARKADHYYDLTSIASPSDSFDMIICYHILEHIEKDRQAMSELYRITRPGGTVLVQTPLRSGNTYENAAILSPEERKVHLGQEDHVRIYSASDLADKLRKAGFRVSPVTYPPDSLHGMQGNETVFFCKKIIFVQDQ